MPKGSLPRPTDAELEILRVLWQIGPSTVRAVHTALAHHRTIGYTTTLKLLQVMHGKGLVTRDEAQRSHIYTAKYQEGQTQTQLLLDLLQRAFGGASQKLVMTLLNSTKVTPQEMDEIRKLMDDAKKQS